MQSSLETGSAIRVFARAIRAGHKRVEWKHGSVELNTMNMAEPAQSELLVGSHVLLGTIGGGAPKVEVAADGSAPWQGSKLSGAAGFFPEGRRVRSKWPAGSLTYVLQFIAPESTSELLDRNADNLDWQTRICAEDPFVSASMQRLALALCDDNDPLAALTVKTIASSLHLHAVGRFSGLKADFSAGDGLDRVLDLIHSELPRSVTLAEMVTASELPRGRFLIAFRTKTGVSPHQYILRERLARARALLETTRRSVDEIAAEVGCASASHLGQLFQRQLGISPHAWRRGRDRL